MVLVLNLVVNDSDSPFPPYEIAPMTVSRLVHRRRITLFLPSPEMVGAKISAVGAEYILTVHTYDIFFGAKTRAMHIVLANWENLNEVGHFSFLFFFVGTRVARPDVERIKRGFNTGEFRTTKRELNIPKRDTAENTMIDPPGGGEVGALNDAASQDIP